MSMGAAALQRRRRRHLNPAGFEFNAARPFESLAAGTAGASGRLFSRHF